MDSTKVVDVIHGSKVYVGRNLLKDVFAEVAKYKASKYVVVSDSNVFKLFGAKLKAELIGSGISEAPPLLADGSAPTVEGKACIFYEIPAGEQSKCRAVKAQIEDHMLAYRCNRDTCMIAVGGGVVGDLCGYVAATYMRGVPFVQIPTSTTAMIDASVGGKTAINVPAGKNLIGAFHQPVAVFADMNLLSTLGRRELVEGISEAIKMGCIRSKSLFELLESKRDEVMRLDEEVIAEVIYESIRLKAEVVALDERESGIRGTLNFGHTIGHAIEALKSPELLHGECVSIGCVAEAELARRMGNASMTTETINRLRKCFHSYGLPVDLVVYWARPADLTTDDLMHKMSLDKKNRGNSIRCTIVTAIGVSINDPQPVEKDLMRQVLSDAALGQVEAPWTPLGGTVAEHASKKARTA